MLAIYTPLHIGDDTQRTQQSHPPRNQQHIPSKVETVSVDALTSPTPLDPETSLLTNVTSFLMLHKPSSYGTASTASKLNDFDFLLILSFRSSGLSQRHSS